MAADSSEAGRRGPSAVNFSSGSPDDVRSALLAAAAKTGTAQLVDVSGRNGLLFY